MTTAKVQLQPVRRPRRRGVIAVLERGCKLLFIRRAKGVAKAGFWCLPGGHVEPGETPRRAIHRELREELGIEVATTERLGSIRVSDLGYILVVWRVRHVAGRLRPAPDEVAEVRWVTPDESRSLTPSLPSNERVLDMLRA